MPRPKRHQPYNPALAEYQRQQKNEEKTKKWNEMTADLPKKARSTVVSVSIIDPDSGKEEDKARQTRDDPLARMLSRKYIDEGQFYGGRDFQRDFEAAERGPKAIDFTKEAVDGGLMPEAITDAQREAAIRLKHLYRRLGQERSALTHDVLIHRLTLAQVCARRGLAGQTWERFFGLRFHECLDTLARFYGYASEDSARRRTPVDEQA